MSHLKVEGHSGLYRDSKTNSIVNKNSTAYNEYMTQKSLRNSGNDKIDNMKNDLDRLNTIIYVSLELIRKISILMYPIIPETSLKALNVFNIKEKNR